jgi:hypothetical protein
MYSTCNIIPCPGFTSILVVYPTAVESSTAAVLEYHILNLVHVLVRLWARVPGTYCTRVHTCVHRAGFLLQLLKKQLYNYKIVLDLPGTAVYTSMLYLSVHSYSILSIRRIQLYPVLVPRYRVHVGPG